MRRLSATFMDCLGTGFLADLRECVAKDTDLNLEIRANYLNVYFKGNSLLKLTEAAPARYRVEIHERFREGLVLPPELVDAPSAARFVSAIPQIKANIARHGHSSIELEYEQLIIRANNHEPRNNSDYFIVDRQYVLPEGRYDLLGIYWERAGRRRNQEVPLCLFEAKFGLNPEIAQLSEQLTRYFEALNPKAAQIAEEVEGVFRQKLALGLYRQPRERVEALQTLRVSRDMAQVQFVVLLVDYNRNSRLLDLPALQALPFAAQIRLLRTGFAMWQQNVLSVGGAVVA
jgi:hypothetical protein